MSEAEERARLEKLYEGKKPGDYVYDPLLGVGGYLAGNLPNATSGLNNTAVGCWARWGDLTDEQRAGIRFEGAENTRIGLAPET